MRINDSLFFLKDLESTELNLELPNFYSKVSIPRKRHLDTNFSASICIPISVVFCEGRVCSSVCVFPLVTLPKLTFWHLKMDGWNTIVSFWVSAHFQVQTVCFREEGNFFFLCFFFPA